MAESNVSSPAYEWYIREIVRALNKDKFLIVLLTVLLTAFGFVAGSKVMKSASSTAHLVVAPMPPQAAAQELELAPKMDITSVVLVCKADEVLRRTLTALNEGGQLTEPISSLRALSRGLDYEITIAKETPYDKAYSDVLKLTAKAKVPEDAAIMVNTWAQEIIDAVDRYEEGVEGPVLAIFNKYYAEAEGELTAMEEERDAWLRTHNLKFLHTQHDKLNDFVMQDIQDLTEIESELSFEKAKLAAYKGAIHLVEPKVTLSWSLPEAGLADLLQSEIANALGVEAVEKDETKAAPPEEGEEEAEDTEAAGDEPAPQDPSGEGGDTSFADAVRQEHEAFSLEGTKFLTREMLNEGYWKVYTELLMSEPTVAGLQAQRESTQMLLEEHQQDLQKVHEEITQLETERLRIERRFEVAEEVFKTFHARNHWIEIAAQLDYHTLHMLSSGGAWPPSRLWGFAGAIVLGFLGFCFAICLSIVVRVFVLPALKAES